jgi:serine/threonine protein kinase
MSSLPTTIGKYQIIREIARSNDIVYEAYDPLMDRRVALKELNLPAGSSDQQRAERVARFERECRAVGRLAHPNIMTVYEFGEDGARTFMAMEFLDGNTLRNEIDTRGALSFERAIEIAKSILAGLDHAHSNGVVHRDIKPDNIQLTSHGVKITDFGIARLTFQPNLTMDGQVFGTPSYMSPEQVRGGDIDARSDIFSVGVLMYEMLTGTKPFTGDSVITITYSILNKDPDPPQQVGYAVWNVIQRALDKSPQLRWSSAKEMSVAIDEAVRQQESGVLAMGTQTVMPGPSSPFGNPYSTPYGTQAPPPPIQYPYNPMTQGPHQTGPIPQGFQLPGNVPIYYPPPPRKPLMTPSQQAMMRRVGAVILVLGTFFGLVIVAILYFTGAFGDVSSHERPRTVVVDARGSRGEEQSIPPSPSSDGAIRQAYEAVNMAKTATTLAERERYLAEAASLYEIAANSEPDGNLQRSHYLKAADASFALFEVRRAMGKSSRELRSALYGVVRNAPEGTELSIAARRELADLS